MSVRFIIGRAGSGKTWRCLEQIRTRLRQDALNGHKLLLIVPEQASFQMERALIETPDIPGFVRCEVLSFQRLAYRIFSHSGADPRKTDQTIGSLGRLMVLRRLIRRHQNELQLLANVADRPGVVKQVSAALDELMHEDVPPEKLAALSEQLTGENPLGAAKLADLARLYTAYLDYLIDDRLDPAQYLDLAAERLLQCEWLSESEVWVDGFAGFTRQEYQLLAGLAQQARNMEISLLMDPSASAIKRDDLPRLSYSLFARTERTLIRLKKTFTQAGVEMAEPILLAGSEQSRYFAPALQQLESGLFRTKRQNDNQFSPPAPETVRVLSFPDRRAEVEAAVAEIHRLTRLQEQPLRYRDIAIIVRDLDAYHDLLSAAMNGQNIPCFIDRRRPTSHHPLVELVRGLLAVAAEDCRLDSVRLLLKTSLLDISNDDGDLLENYLIAHGIQGRSAWSQYWPFTRMFSRRSADNELSQEQQAMLQRVNQVRRSWLQMVDPWLEQAAEWSLATGQQWAHLLFNTLEHLQVAQRLEQWARQDEEDGRADEAEMHRQVWRDFVELLDELVRAMGTESMSLHEFREALESALAEFTLGLAPPTLDQVLVGSIERSRHPAIKAALVLGFDENHFPQKTSEDPLLGDQEREQLAVAGMEIGPTRRQQIISERMLAYIAMTRAGQRLWISYPRQAADGHPVQPSPYLSAVLEALPGLEPEPMGEPRMERQPEWITRVKELGARLAGEFRIRGLLTEESQSQQRSLWNAIFNQAIQHEDWQYTLSRCLAGLKYQNRVRLSAESAEQAISQPLTTSVSRLEKFAACPFAHFAQYMLKLEQRVEAGLNNLELGTICHAILECFIREVAEEDWPADDQDEWITQRIEAITKEMLPQLTDEMMLADARNRFLYDRSRHDMTRSAHWQRRVSTAGKFRPRKVEFPFGYSGDSAAPLTLTTPKGREIRLRGKIDRVDVAEIGNELAAVVIDYKRTRQKAFSWTEAYHGLTLQLAGYMLAIQQAGESLTGRPVKPIRPVAALYLPLKEGFQSVAHPEDGDKKTPSKLKGVIDKSAAELLGKDNDARKKFYSAAITKKEGKADKRSDLLETNDFKILFQYIGRKMGQLADDLIDGKIDVAPYRLNRQMPCSYCPYKPVCRYEIDTQLPRILESKGDKSAVMDTIIKEGDNG